MTPYASLASVVSPITMRRAPVGRDAAYEWSSVARSHELTVEHAAKDIDTDHVLYHMALQLETPLPPDALDQAQYVCLTWPYGGLWRIERVADDRTRVHCVSWRKTDLKHGQVDDHAREVRALATRVASARGRAPDELLAEEALDEGNATHGDALPHLFKWKMMRGSWGGDAHHWFIRDVAPPDAGIRAPPPRHLVVKLFVGFAPLEARIEVNAVTAVDTVAQMYSADVTWQVTLPAITALREDTVLLEFLDIVEIDASQFEFNNVKEMRDERALTSSVTPAGDVHFRDLTLPGVQSIARPHVESAYHLQFSRRVIASFTEEMTLHSFPFDQQKLIFEFSTGSSGMPDGALQLIPAPVEPGSFSIEDFQLGNVFDVAYYNKVFVSEIKESGPRKSIAFELVLERRSYYYLTNVALTAAVITYLCFFVSWSPENGSDGELTLMDTGSRLQNVTAMVLTAVTFKNQVASLIPQISYFTILDRYVFVCFMVTSLVTVENALFPLLQRYVIGERTQDLALLGYSLAAFTLFNIVWAAYIRWWLDRRRYAARVLMQVHEYVRLITDLVPAGDRVAVLERFLEEKKLDDWCKPKYVVTGSGDIHIQAPDDVPTTNGEARLHRAASFRDLQHACHDEVASLKRIYEELRPDRRSSRRIAPASSRDDDDFTTSPVGQTIPAAKTTASAYQVGALRLPRMASVVAAVTHSAHVPILRRRISADDAHDTAVHVDAQPRTRPRSQPSSKHAF